MKFYETCLTLCGHAVCRDFILMTTVFRIVLVSPDIITCVYPFLQEMWVILNFCLNMTVFMCHWLLGIKNVILFITGFRGLVDQKHLEKFFRQFGQIKKLIYDHSNKFAIVQFYERFVLE
jgi:hypothetical protein